MDVLSLIPIIASIPITTPLLYAIEIGGALVWIYHGVGPALQPIAPLGVFGQVAYYTLQPRFRDVFVPIAAAGIFDAGWSIYKRGLPGNFWLSSLVILSGSWLWSVALTKIEADKFSDKPKTEEEEEELWTEGLTRREFLERNKRG
ncbi:hypothetical protein F4808DRAFT_431403 [Astrocystis sublimbata]|nr:hypothetical protein F4808DRAFT_431403 [Astrocystis sublimbata]